MIKIINADVIEGLKSLPDKSVQMVVTSPPYFNLRDYSRCDCATRRQYSETMRTFGGADRTDGCGGNLNPSDTRCQKDPDPDCKKCGGTGVIKGMESQIGMEETPELYVQKMVEVFREVKRVLRDDGCAWLNLGDSYAGSGGAHAEHHENPGLSKSFERGGSPHYGNLGIPARYLAPKGLKSKDLCMIPARVAMALCADGWYLRSQIPFIKRNSMPESCTDRPGSSVEYIYLLAKSERYFFDSIAIRKDASESYTNDRRPVGVLRQRVNENTKYDRNVGQYKKQDLTGNPTYTGFNQRWQDNPDKNPGRNRRNSDWFFESWQGLYVEDDELLGMIVNPVGFPDAHFAVFPTRLVEPLIKAGTSEYGACPKCGAPWERIVEKELTDTEGWGISTKDHTGDIQGSQSCIRDGKGRCGTSVIELKGWKPTCDCNRNNVVPCVVLDPFGGSGTTGEVARELKRDAILIDLNPEYIKIMKRRLRLNEQLGFD